MTCKEWRGDFIAAVCMETILYLHLAAAMLTQKQEQVSTPFVFLFTYMKWQLKK